MRCLYCLKELETYAPDHYVRACVHCGCQYAVELLEDLDTEKILADPRYEIERHAGTPPTVTIYDRKAQLR